MTAKFLRRTWSRYSKLGKRRKNKQVWRKPTGRDNKMREKRRGYPAIVSIGHRTDKKSRGKVKEKIPKTVRNLLDLKNLEKNDIIILGRIGNKNKIKIVEKAKEKGIEIYNLNKDKFLEKNKLKGVKKNEPK